MVSVFFQPKVLLDDLDDGVIKNAVLHVVFGVLPVEIYQEKDSYAVVALLAVVAFIGATKMPVNLVLAGNRVAIVLLVSPITS